MEERNGKDGRMGENVTNQGCARNLRDASLSKDC